jgi:negative regulator of sigma E activity
MKITDETLSAFLDSELTDAEMEAVRNQLAQDPTLADRLAELASVDAALQSHYDAIEERPMPESVTRMVESAPLRHETVPQNNVVSFPWWRRLRGHTGKAAAAAVIAGVALMQWFTVPSGGEPAWPEVAEILETEPSGQAYPVNSQATLTPRLTFRNQTGEWCRQYRLGTDNTASEQLACRSDAGDWQRMAKTETRPVADPETYQTASGGSALDPVLDRMMKGAPVGPDEERALIDQQWSKQ